MINIRAVTSAIIISKLPRRGFTILELLVALSIASITLSAMYYVWNTINRHIILHSKSSLVRDENVRIIRTVAGSLRRSPAIIDWNYNHIRFVDPNNPVDTIDYSFTGTVLCRNSEPIQLRSKVLFVSAFLIQESQISQPGEGDLREYLHILLTIEDNSGNKSTLTSEVTVMRPREQF